MSLVINFIGGPGCGKSVTAARLFVDLKTNTKGLKIEYLQEYVKPLVWKIQSGDPHFTEAAEEALNNQRQIANEIYQILKIMAKSNLDIIITDGTIFHGIYYNKVNPGNTSDPVKTEKFILEKFKEFNNFNILVKRGDLEYEQEGRQQNYHEAREVDKGLEKALNDNQIPYMILNIHDSANYQQILSDIMNMMA